VAAPSRAPGVTPSRAPGVTPSRGLIRRPRREKSTRELTGELWDLVVDYFKQEAVDPLRVLGRYLGWGLAGAVFVGTGVVLLVLGGLRLVQTETGPRLSGDLTWAPYGMAMAVCALVVFVLVRVVGIERRRAQRRRGA